MTLASCGSEEVKPLILYYSQTGATEAVAQELQTATGADIESIELVNPYSGTYDETIARVSQEMEDGVLPELNPLKSDLSKYDVIFLAYPFIIAKRIKHEEAFLEENLDGYRAYMQKVKYRLIPFVW